MRRGELPLAVLCCVVLCCLCGLACPPSAGRSCDARPVPPTCRRSPLAALPTTALTWPLPRPTPSTLCMCSGMGPAWGASVVPIHISKCESDAWLQYPQQVAVGAGRDGHHHRVFLRPGDSGRRARSVCPHRRQLGKQRAGAWLLPVPRVSHPFALGPAWGCCAWRGQRWHSAPARLAPARPPWRSQSSKNCDTTGFNVSITLAPNTWYFIIITHTGQVPQMQLRITRP